MEFFEYLMEELPPLVLHQWVGPLIFSIGIGNRFPSVEDRIVEVLWDGALIVVIKEVADVWCIAVGVLEDVYNDPFIMSHLRGNRNEGNWSVSRRGAWYMGPSRNGLGWGRGHNIIPFVYGVFHNTISLVPLGKWVVLFVRGVEWGG